ncbi:MAG: dTDP-4-dehydrorhamnose 3,5-epimerase [Candidatus Hydrogenedentota bacterium]
MPLPIITPTEVPDVLIIESPRFGDERGYFMEAWSAAEWAKAGFHDAFVQDSLSVSSSGTLRGLHYQIGPHAQGKFVRALRGALFDVAVDIRKGSPTFGKWAGRELSEANGLAMWIPPGFAHGFLALEEKTMLYYKCTTPYAPKSERGIRFDDPAIGIVWPCAPSNMSERDRQSPLLAQADYNFVYQGS